MAFHETFWVVAGAAAPVIALASVVSLPQLQDLAGSLEIELMDEIMKADARQCLPSFVRARARLRIFMVILSWVPVANMSLQAILLGESLNSLANDADRFPLHFVGYAESTGILLVAVGTVGVGQAKVLRRRIEHMLSEEPRILEET